MSGEPRIIRHVVVRGHVQGVGYRAFVEFEALKAGIEGWVRNRHDGSVEAVLAGPVGVVEPVIVTCRRGPFSARVDEILQRDGGEDDLTPRRPGESFSVLATG